jgi:hypothetical protein
VPEIVSEEFDYENDTASLDYCSQKESEDHKQYAGGKMEASKKESAIYITVNCFSKTIQALKEVKIDKSFFPEIQDDTSLK